MYLTDKLNDIKTKSPFCQSIPASWPSKYDINTLCFKASSQFIYAATVVRFIDHHSKNPIGCLAACLKAPLSADSGQVDTAFVQLDELYHEIFCLVDDPKRVHDIIYCLLFCEKISTQDLEIILGYDTWESLGILCDMHSLLLIPDLESKDVENDPKCHFIEFHHTSLQDFLFDSARAKNLYINPTEASIFVVNCIIKHFKGIFKSMFRVYF